MQSLDRLILGLPVSWGRLLLAIVAGGMLYGAVMGSFASLVSIQVVYSAIKVPLLIMGTVLLSLPIFYVLHVLLGVVEDFPEAIRCVFATQGAVAINLLSFAPLVFVWYFTSIKYTEAVTVNAIIFAVASFAGQIVLKRHYRELIRKNRRHLWLQRFWITVYAFVGIQMGWVFRPFIGDPGIAPSFIRETAWGNAYVVVFEMCKKWFQSAF